MSTSSETNIESAIRDINNILKNHKLKSEVLVLDFTHITEVDEKGSIYDIKFFIVCDENKKYIQILKQEKDRKGGYARFTQNHIRIVQKLNSNSKNLKPYYKLNPPDIERNLKITNEFKPSEWHKVLTDAKYGSVSVVVSRKHSEAQSAVYLILKGDFPLPDNNEELDFNNIIKASDVESHVKTCLDEILLRLEQLLLDEMLHNLYTDKQEAEIERKALIAFEKMILAHKHSFFQLDVETPLQNALDYLALSKHEDAQNSLQAAIKQNQILHIINSALFGRIEKLEGETNNRISGVLDFLSKNYVSVSLKPHIAKLVKNDLDKISDPGRLIDWFTLIFNLWSNGIRSYGGKNKEFNIIFKEEGNKELSLTFTNQYPIENKYLLFINGETNIYPNKDLNYDVKYKGLQIVIDIVRKLDNTSNTRIHAHTREGKTEIKLMFKAN